jgi:outer membrane protein assembly factor BamB
MAHESITDGTCGHRVTPEHTPASRRMLCLSILSVFCWTASLAAETCEYLGNDQRTGYVDAQPPEDFSIAWTFHERHAPMHAWQDPTREVQHIDFDYSSQLCVTDGLVIFGSSADHTLRALDLTTGKQQWKLHLGAPIRFAPEPGDGCIYVAGDDGFVRCLATKTGEELWKLRTGPRDTHCMGNDQLISRWPCRSGVLLAGDKLYCTGGMWSRDGVYIYCLDAGTGTIIWKNDTSGFHYSVLPHSEGYNGVSPQGNLVLYKGILYVPAGRAEPAFYDATTGELLHCETGVGYKAHYPGGSWVMAFGDRVWFKRRQNHQGDQAVRDEVMDPIPGFGSGIIGWNYKTGLPEIALTDKNLAVVKDDTMILSGAGPVIRLSYAKINEANREYNKDGKSLKVDPNVKSPGKQYGFLGNFMAQAKNRPNRVTPMMMSPLPYQEWETDIGRVFTMMIAGDKVIAGGRGTVKMLDLETGENVAQQTVEGEVRNLAVVDERIVLSTTAGRIYCLGGDGPQQTIRLPQTTVAIAENAEVLAKQILDESGIREGYCFLPRAGSQTDLMLALIRHSELNVFGMEPDQKKIDAARARLDEAGVLGVRGQVIKSSGSQLPVNPYIADLVVCTDALAGDKEQVRELFRITRPCGGIAYCVTDDTTGLAVTVSDAAPGDEVKRGQHRSDPETGPHQGCRQLDAYARQYWSDSVLGR